MKKNLFLSRILSVLVISAVTLGSYHAQAGIMHPDVSYQTYADFGQNLGRYVVGNKVNALLGHIRTEAGGITISYTNGQADRVAISNEQGMINFSSVIDTTSGACMGAAGAIGPNMLGSVDHMWSANASFADCLLGEDKAINYKAIDRGGSNVFRITPGNDEGREEFDYALQRQSKIITDAVWNPLSTMSMEDIRALKDQHLYRAGAGTMTYWNGSGQSDLCGAYGFITGGINRINSGYAETTVPTISFDEETKNFTITSNAQFWGRGPDASQPLPNPGDQGDSGSPMFIYNKETQRYEYLMAFQSDGDNYGYNVGRGNLEWTAAKMESFNERVNMTAINTVYLNAVTTTGDTISDSSGNSTVIVTGVATDTQGNTIATYNGIYSGVNTWNDLSGIKDTEHWYAYDNSYLYPSIDDLFFTENLVFTPTQTENTIILNDTVDLGIGYAEFNGGNFTIQSESGEINEFNHAGYVINEGATVHLQLTNNANHMTEWRKTGAGTLVIDGTGDTNALINVGGVGATILDRSGGYAAYNVLANTEATVQIKGGINQIKRDFTFGAGGGTLDMYGHDLEWDNSVTDVETDGFTIHALTEEAIITSTNGTSTLTITDAGTEFLGSFRDSENGALKVIYNGSGTLAMHSIHTNLSNSFEVKSGHVSLSGTNTLHGKGSKNGGVTTERIEKTNDWHYADATMNVEVSGGTFELGSHARLTGDVNVTSGTYIMREGVQHDEEYVEGGANLEAVSKYADYYGHKGNISLAKGANLQIAYNSGVTAYNEYGGDISGEGNVSIALGTTGATLNLAGNIEANELDIRTGNVQLTGEHIQVSGNSANSGILKIGAGSTVEIGSDASAPTVDVSYYVSLGTSGGTLPANLILNNGRLNIGEGGIAINSSAAVTVNGGTLGTSAAEWQTTQNMTVAGNLTVDTQRVDTQEVTGGIIRLGGAISGDGGITKTGLGTLELSGTVNLQQVDVLSGSLSMTGSSNAVAHVSIAQGAALSMTGGYTLGADNTLTVLKSAQGGSALLNSLVANGGTLVFDGSALQSEGAALSINSISGSAAKVSFSNISYLNTDSSYALADGNWGAISVSASGNDYLTPEFVKSDSGLAVIFNAKDGYTLWNGKDGHSTWDADTFAQSGSIGGNVAVFNDSAAVKEVTVAGDVSAGGILFDASADYTFTGEGSISAGNLDITGTGRVEMNADLTVSGEISLADGVMLAGSGDITADSLNMAGVAILSLNGAEHSIGTLNAASGTVQLNSAILNLGANTHEIKSVSSDGDSTINLATGGTLNRINSVSGEVKLTGNGTYKMGAGKMALVDAGTLALHATDWTGTVELTSAENKSNVLNGLNLNDYGNAGSTVKLVGVLGSLMDATGDTGVTFTSNLVLQNNNWAALELTSGNAGDSFIFSGNITGGGNFVKNNTAQQSFTFSGDVSGWRNGNYRVVTGDNNLTLSGNATTINLTKIYTENNAAGTTTVTFSNANAVTVNSIISQGSNSTLNVVADAAGGTTFIKQVTAGCLTVRQGTVNLNASSNSIGALSVAGATITLAENASLIAGGFVEGGAQGSQFSLNSGSNLIFNNAGTIAFNNFDSNAGAKATGSGTVIIGNGTIVQLTNSDQKKDAAVAGTIKVQGGGRLELTGGASLLGHDDGGTDAVYLVGSEGMLATMHITSTGTQHLSTDLHLQGNAQVTGSGTIESYLHDKDGKIHAQGTNNTIAANINLNRTLTVDVASDAELNVSGTIGHAGSGSKNIIKTGTGTLIVSGNNTYTGGTSINGGVLKLGSATALGSGSVTVNAGGTLDVNGKGDTTYVVTLAAGATLQNSGNGISTGTKQIADITLNGNATVTGTANFAMVAASHDQASLDLNGNTLIKTGNNTFTISNTAVTAGTLKVTQGTLQAMQQQTGDGKLDISAATVEVGRVAEGNVGTFQLSGNSEAIKALTFDGGKVSVDTRHCLTVSGATTVTGNGGTLQGMVQLNSVSVEGSLNIGNGTDVGVIINNLNAQTGTIGGTISSVSDNSSISIAGTDADNKAIVANTLIDIMAGCTLNMSNVVLQDTSRITDNPATFNVNNVVAQVSANNITAAESATMTATQLRAFGTGETLDVLAGATVYDITSSLMDTVSVTGSDFIIDLTGNVDLTGVDYVSFTFTTEGAAAASFATDMNITLVYEGTTYDVYYAGDDTTKLYAAIPEPGTATLSLLALATLAARRRRR